MADAERTTIFTAGHSNRSADALVELLAGAGVAGLADVRRHPASRRHPHFDRETLAARLAASGIAYTWWGAELGGRQPARLPAEASPNRAWQEPAFRHYADAMERPAFQGALDQLVAEAAKTPTALLCAERDWRHCHRQLLADALLVRGLEVVHLLDPGRREPHVLNGWARVDGDRLTYPGLL